MKSTLTPDSKRTYDEKGIQKEESIVIMCRGILFTRIVHGILM